MKTLKGFVRQRVRPKGSMAKGGWLIQVTGVISKFLDQKDEDVPLLWTNKDS